MSKIIDGKKLADKIKDNLVKEIIKLGERPNLAIILVGDREDSSLYVGLKEKEAKKVGIDTHLYKCPENISEKEVLETINHLNKDELIDAILIQLPLPENLDTDKIIKAINPLKDVDGFHPDNLDALLKECEAAADPWGLRARRPRGSAAITPPVFAVVLEMLKSINYEIADKQVCVISNSDIFGKSLSKILECRGAKVTVAHGDDKDLKNKTSKADILITAVGKPEFIKKDMVKKDAVVIDIGITTKNTSASSAQGKKVYGDVDFNDVKDIAGFITPVPGGVGPMTIAMAFKNVLELYKRIHKY